jgi:hypothetical protein
MYCYFPIVEVLHNCDRFLDHGGNVPKLLSIVALFIWSASSLAQTASSSQETKQTPTKRVRVDQSVVVGADLTPEEAEEGKINDIYPCG